MVKRNSLINIDWNSISISILFYPIELELDEILIFTCFNRSCNFTRKKI